MNIYERDNVRQKLLVEIYHIVDGDILQPINLKSLLPQINIDQREFEKVYHYLIDEGFIEPFGSGYTIILTHYGIKTVESFLRKIDFNENIQFNSTELFQLKIILDEIKEQIEKLQLGQEVIFNEIDKTFDESKVKTKEEWKNYFISQIKDWGSQKIIDNSAQLILQGILAI